MSYNLVSPSDGSLIPVASKGRAEYGASTVRQGSASIPGQSSQSSQTISVTFDTPMPDADYHVVFKNRYGSGDVINIEWQTKNGFSFTVFNVGGASGTHSADYFAFKLYSDVEYSNIVNSMPSNASASNKLVTRNQSGAILPIVDLGTEYTAELKADIQSGKFEKAVVGGKLIINGHAYYFAHPDYWLHTGDTECTQHHMLVIPADNIGTGKMNSTNTTAGGYISSDLRTGNNGNTALATAKAQIIADFGAANILTHRELFTNAVTDGRASSWTWVDSDIDLMSEVMVYGCNVWASHPGYETGIDKCQIKLFQERPDLIITRAYWWLRSVVSATLFALVGNGGAAHDYDASYALGVRPIFAIC